jgi:hypothetical protein
MPVSVLYVVHRQLSNLQGPLLASCNLSPCHIDNTWVVKPCPVFLSCHRRSQHIFYCPLSQQKALYHPPWILQFEQSQVQACQHRQIHILQDALVHGPRQPHEEAAATVLTRLMWMQGLLKQESICTGGKT